MWNGMQRNALTGDIEIEVIQEEEDEASQNDADGNPVGEGDEKKKQKKTTYLKFKENEGLKTLESNLKNITMTSFDTQHEVDPLFKKTTQMFDDVSNSNLLSGTLQTTPSLLLQLDSHMAHTANEQEDKEISKLASEQGTSSRYSKLVNSYIGIIRETFDINSYQKLSQAENFLCDKYEDLMDHVKNVAHNMKSGRPSSPSQKQEEFRPEISDQFGTDKFKSSLLDDEPQPFEDGAIDPYQLENNQV